MTRKRIPKPPATDNPIVILREMSLEQELGFLDEFMAAYEAGDVDRAATCALNALDTPMERKLVDSLISTVNNLAYHANNYSPLVTQLLCKAADSGYHQHSYNAANQLISHARTPEEFRVAERYFKLAMAFTENPALQAAAHVNYCPIIRDGLISGVPNWPAAVEIYETAARMGLVKAMFNAANVSDWLVSKGDRSYAARAVHWYEYALDYRANKKPTLDMEMPAELDEVFQQCMLGLSGCHIDSRFEGADLEEGIRWAKTALQAGLEDARHNLGVGYTRRLTRMTTEPHRLPGENWRAVLSQLDWTFHGDVETIVRMLPKKSGGHRPVDLDKLTVRLSDNSMFPLYVTHDHCLPCFDKGHLLEAIAANLAKSGNPNGFFLLPRKALFIEEEGSPYTPIYAYRNGYFGTQALGMATSPDQVLQDLDKKIDFADARPPSWTCMIPIAVNALDEGFVVAGNTRFDQPWVGVGGPFRMPFVKEEHLAEFGIFLQR